MHYFYLVLLLISSYLASAWAQPIPDVVVEASQVRANYNLAGVDGVNGYNGQDAYTIPCEDYPFRRIDGIDGEPGHSGEDGQDGGDVLIKYESLYQLTNVSIRNSGGYGGLGGAGGKGSEGCNGGFHGEDGQDGNNGNRGEYGKVFLVPNSLDLPTVNSTQLVTIEELLRNQQKLSFIKWSRNTGLKNLLHISSDISGEYFTFDGTVEKEIRVEWNSELPLSEFNQLKLGLHLAADGLHINNYRGPILNYRVVETPSRSTIIIDKVIREESFANLSLGKLRSTMFDLMLEVKRKYDLLVPLRTIFNLSLFEVEEGTDKLNLVGHFRIPDELVEFDEDRFRIYIGKLNYPLQYKQRGVKLRVFLSVTRETDSQRRTYVLRGLYRI